MEKYDRALRIGEGIELQASDGKRVLQTERILGGIVPGTDVSPFYACAFGQIPHANKAGKKASIFLGEAENEMPEPFFDRLVELARKFFCWTWYFNVSDQDETGIEALYQMLKDYKSKRDISQVKLSQSQTIGWPTGIALIQQWAADEALKIEPGSILSVQLGRMTPADRHATRRKHFYAVDALRATIGIASQNPPPRSSGSKPVNFFYG